jgi:hypothetical protein
MDGLLLEAVDHKSPEVEVEKSGGYKCPRTPG